MSERDTRFLEISEIFPAPVWCGRTSGGYGNGPYRKYIVVGEKPDDRVLDHIGGCDVVERWSPAVCSDVSNWHDLNTLTGSIPGEGDRAFHDRRGAVMEKLVKAFPDHNWFWI